MAAHVPLATGGAPLAQARCALVMLHGRGANQDKTLAYATRHAPPDVAVLVPAGEDGPWWPYRHDVPVAADDRHLLAALATVARTVEAALAAGLTHERIVMSGFSMGACLALEHVARTGTPYRATVAMTGALLGTLGPGPSLLPEGEPGRYTADLTGQKIVVTTHAGDRQVPVPFVDATARILRARGARVALHVEPGDVHKRTDTDAAFIAAALSREGLTLPEAAPDTAPIGPTMDELLAMRRNRRQNDPRRKPR